MTAYSAGDLARAARIWEPIADAGDVTAQYSLGKLYETGGAGLPRDDARAIKWYRLAAAQGEPPALNNLGLMYAEGRGVKRDTRAAVELWRKAARRDHPMAQFNLALAFFRGEGVAEDAAAAEVWFGRAAELGLADSQYALGQIKALGLIGEADLGAALYWYQLAVAQGYAKAREPARKLRQEGVKPRLRRQPPTVAAAGAAAKTGPKTAPAEGMRVAPQPPPTAAASPPRPLAPPTPADAGTAARSAPAEPDRQGARLDQRPAAGGGKGLAGAGSDPGAAAWLLSTRSEEAAHGYLRLMIGKHPDILAPARALVAAVDWGEGGTFYRVVAGGLADHGAAEELCARLRAAEPDGFCKALPVRSWPN